MDWFADERCGAPSDDGSAEMTESPMALPELGYRSVAVHMTLPAPLPVASFVLVAVDNRAMILLGFGAGADESLLGRLATVAVSRIE